MISIYPSLMPAKVLSLEEDIKKLEPYCQGFHLDIMDFHFVQNLCWSIDAVNQIRRATNKRVHVHLMVEYPERYIPLLELNAYDIVSVHIESPTEFKFEEILKIVKLKQLTPSIAINPFTPIEAIIGIQFPLEHALILSVDPGFSGQKFLPNTLEKIKSLALFKKSHNLSFDISVDGGINSENLKEVIQAGANEIAMASAIFASGNPEDSLKSIRELAKVA